MQRKMAPLDVNAVLSAVCFRCERQGFGEGDAVVFVLHGQFDGFIGDGDVGDMGIACVKAMGVVADDGLGGGGVPLAVALVVEAEFVDVLTADVMKVFGFVASVGADKQFLFSGRYRGGGALVFLPMAEDISIVRRGFRQLRKGGGEGCTAQEQGQEKAARHYGGMMTVCGGLVKAMLNGPRGAIADVNS